MESKLHQEWINDFRMLAGKGKLINEKLNLKTQYKWNYLCLLLSSETFLDLADAFPSKNEQEYIKSFSCNGYQGE